MTETSKYPVTKYDIDNNMDFFRPFLYKYFESLTTIQLLSRLHKAVSHESSNKNKTSYNFDDLVAEIINNVLSNREQYNDK